MIKPVDYKQYDAKWGSNNYSAKGEKRTIQTSGCGITCMAMVVATLVNNKITPADTAVWSMEHGYKALNQGTYYSYFEPAGKHYGLSVKQLNTANCYGYTSAAGDKAAKTALQDGDYVIACMGPGRWTKSGHFVILYKIDDEGYVYINDPASTAPNRLKAKWSDMAKEAKYYWKVDVPKYKDYKPSHTISSASTKYDIAWCKKMLKKAGCYTGSITGTFNKELSNAIYAFWKSKKWKISTIGKDGYYHAGSKTINALSK